MEEPVEASEQKARKRQKVDPTSINTTELPQVETCESPNYHALPMRTTRKVVEDESGKILVIKGAWSPEEDDCMLQAVKDYGFDWKKIAQRVKGRSAKQCRDRYRLKLDPSINHGPWTPEEDELLLKLHNEIGRCWTRIAKLLPGRTENAVKSRYSSLFRAKTKEWSEGEEQLLQRLHGEGVSFEVIAKQHLPHRSEHAVKKRWEKMLMKQIASQIKKKLPTLSKQQPSETVTDNVPKLNPALAASTVSTVKVMKPLASSNVEDVEEINHSTKTPAPIDAPPHIPQSQTKVTNPLSLLAASTPMQPDMVPDICQQQSVGFGGLNPLLFNTNMTNNSSRLQRTITSSSNISIGSGGFTFPNFILPVNGNPNQFSEIMFDNTNSEDTKEKNVNFNVATKQTGSIEPNNNTTNNVKKESRASRLKRYSTSTTVMMQLIGEPLNMQ